MEQPINILIVDDEPKNLTVLETVLDRPDYRLVRAESADQALLALISEEFALLILDIRMPGMTGFELAQVIKERKKTAQIPIIFLTAYYNEDQHALAGYSTGAVDYLHKPVNPTILRSKVAVFAELHRKNLNLLAEVTERRRAEEQLRELNDTLEQRVTERTEAFHLSEARYRHLLQTLPEALYTCDERGRISLYNQAAVNLWGREPEIGGDLWCGAWNMYRPDGAPLPLDACPMAVTLREGLAIRGEEIIIERPDGTRRHVLAHQEPMQNADGVVVGSINMLIDITDRKQGEQAVANLAAIVTSSDDAIIGSDLRGIVTSWNDAAERLFGYTAKDMIGHPVSRIISQERYDEESHVFEQIMHGELIKHYETIRHRKDGSELTVSLTVSQVVDLQGKINGTSQIVRDITEKIRVEEALRRSERDLSDFFNNASVGLHWVGPDGMIIRVNQTELDLLGYSREEYVGRHIAEFHVDQPAIQDILERLACGETLHEYPARIRGKDGSVLEVLINSNALFEDGKFVHTRCFTRDITERKKAEATLQKQTAKLQEQAQILNLAHVLVRDLEDRITQWNVGTQRLYGFEPSEAVGKISHDRLLTEFPEPLERIRETMLREGRWDGELTHTTKDGRSIVVASHWILHRDENGEPVAILEMNSDITARKRAEEALLDSRDELQHALDFQEAVVTSMGEGLYTVNDQGLVTSVNKAAETLFGWTREELLGRNMHDLTHYAHRDGTPFPAEACAGFQVLRGGKALIDHEDVFIRKDGSCFDVVQSSSPLIYGGKIAGLIIVFRDVSDQKRVKEALRENEERFRMLADNVSQFAWMADATGAIFWYNRRWYEYTGTTFEEMRSWGWEKVHHPDHLHRVVKKWRHTHATGEPWEDTFPLRGHDGTYRWFLSRALPIRDAEGRIDRWFGTNTDITELRDTQAFLHTSEERLREQASALAEANKDLESFSYSVSHDLRAPLRTIVAFNRIMEEDHGAHLNAEARRCVTIVHKAATEAGQLIDDLLEFSRLGRRGLTVRVVSMADLARQAMDELKVLQEGRKIDIHVEDLPPCQGDPRLLKLVWTNLIENAFKYTKYRNEAKIEVGWMPDDASPEAVTYYVKDDGVGFDMRYAHKLFGVFQRLHRKEDFEGTGVGLAIVQRIVQRHGGRVWAEGTVDGGATFLFSLRKAAA
jgi:PAS domain S-box-containing protein